MREHRLPGDIEQTSMAILTRELTERGIALDPDTGAVVRRVIHATADFDYAKTLRFTSGAVRLGAAALGRGCDIVTDTNMARAGVSGPGMEKLGGAVRCFMAEPAIAAAAKEAGTTRAVASMVCAAERYPNAVYAVGNAPTALLKLAELLEGGLRPALIVGVPVGFVNVVESKERIYAACEKYGVPAIVAMGRKGGSTVAAAICNALIYLAADMTDPAKRGWR